MYSYEEEMLFKKHNAKLRGEPFFFDFFSKPPKEHNQDVCFSERKSIPIPMNFLGYGQLGKIVDEKYKSLDKFVIKTRDYFYVIGNRGNYFCHECELEIVLIPDFFTKLKKEAI